MLVGSILNNEKDLHTKALSSPPPPPFLYDSKVKFYETDEDIENLAIWLYVKWHHFFGDKLEPKYMKDSIVIQLCPSNSPSRN